MNFKPRLWIFAALLMILPVAACSGVSATVHFRADDEFNYLTIDMTEEQVQTLFAGILEESDDLHITNPVVDLRAGEISISGEVPSGSDATAPVSLIVQAAMENSQPSLEVTSISFAGWEGTPDILENINSEIAEGLASAAEKANDAQLTEVSITEDSLSFTLRGPRNE
jgi:hypothetical protein